MVEFSRNVTYNPTHLESQSFMDFSKSSRSVLCYTAATDTKISPVFYDYSTPKNPVEFHLELDHVGKTSYCMKTQFFFEGIEEPVVENKYTMVFIDSESMKSSQPPEWWKEKYASGLEKRQGLKIPRNVIPETGVLFGKQVQIAASNLDQFLHTNWSNYLKFCYDALVEYEVKKLGQENILNSFRKVKQFSLLFLQESSLMDTLDVQLWKDQENPYLFKFKVLKKTEDVCDCQIEFHS
ncbi:hypothetical protein ElyMa_003056500 [Elysia marginata]|uniref:Uncharacterized protein n=1 Tax=Elysia marginata TaxID=1093978 RepID=A0AAV4IEI3_9GAST|nr:hypothetical protein ElyMa_003056500 [Elysia marginata]